MKKWICKICGHVHEGSNPPNTCPICKAGKEQFVEQGGASGLVFADEHRIGIAKGLNEEVVKGLRMNFEAECTEVGMYLAMGRQADRQGYPEIGEFFKRAALEEADHASRFAELLGEVVTEDTKKNLEMRVAAEHAATQGKKDLTTLAKKLDYDAIHDTVHEMCKDEARHGRGFEGLLNRYFGKK